MKNSIEGSVIVPSTGGISATIADRMPIIAVLMIGLVMLYGVGFSTASAAHNATHDTRHASGFPCH